MKHLALPVAAPRPTPSHAQAAPAPVRRPEREAGERLLGTLRLKPVGERR
jgi:hypothetical protein